MTLSERELRIDRAVRAAFLEYWHAPWRARREMEYNLRNGTVFSGEIEAVRKAWKALRPPQPRDKHGRFA